MATYGRSFVSFIVFAFSVGYALVTVQMATTGVERETSLISAAASCATSRRCGWIIHDKDEGTYSTRDSADCSEATKRGTDHYNSVIYKKLSNEIQDGKNKRYTQFKLVDIADSGCRKLGEKDIGI